MSEQAFGFGCRGCNRISKTERELLGQGCEGKHEPLVFASEIASLRTSLKELVEAGNVLAYGVQIALGGTCDYGDTLEDALKDWREFLAAADHLTGEEA